MAMTVVTDSAVINKQFRSRRMVLILAAALLLVPILMAGRDYLWAKEYGADKPFRHEAFERVAAAVMSGALPYVSGVGAHAGEAALPDGMTNMTVNGKCYVSRGKAGEWMILFPSYVGRRRFVGDDHYVAGYLYYTRPIRNPNADTINRWFVDVKVPGPLWDASHRDHTVPDHFHLVNLLSKNWYQIETAPAPPNRVHVVW